jgi:hypothetical protein
MVRKMTRLVVVFAFLGCIGLPASDSGAKMYDTGDEPRAQQTVPPNPSCGSPPPMLCGPYPYGRHMMLYPRGRYGTYLDDTRRGIQFLDISGGK